MRSFITDGFAAALFEYLISIIICWNYFFLWKKVNNLDRYEFDVSIVKAVSIDIIVPKWCGTVS